jgi:pullulanase-type alpha-1,6-glucosidase
MDPATGVWSAEKPVNMSGKYYKYAVDVIVDGVGLVRNMVTDPYSVSLAANSTRSQIVDLSDARLKPVGWDALVKPALGAPTEFVIYELHMRDFSSSDPSVPEHLRGTYAAFAVPDSYGIRHLRRLAQAGMTHVHLLPVFDIASIEEERALHQHPDPERLASFPPDSPAQQQIVGALRDRDAFNWGYDPYHYTVPEGSYATKANGPARIREFRTMVQALSQIGLRVVMDVVYNHTHASGQQAASVLDKLVPGYYHRLNADGAIENSTCCHNTATEHAMMEKLMLDSLRTWATAYKVDGFRFDLMGHHMVENIVNARDMLGALTPERDGVDGQAIYLYGEGWNFGEVANNARGRNATQINMAGTTIGTFNDRLRDAVRGGGAFSGFQEQGFANGLFSAPNWSEWRSAEEQRAALMKYADWIKVGLAGNLRDYQLEDRHGHRTSGSQIEYNGQPAGYTLSPREHVIYVSAHDNETLFDAIQLKAPPGTVAAERARMAVVALSLVLLSQGVPFVHAGDELLRSKSLDRNSYDSGDWFNRIDWTYQTNNWGVGLPPEDENRSRWPIMAAILADPTLRPTSSDIQRTLACFEEFLKIRKSSRLFRLRTAADIHRSLGFFNTGPYQSAGLIVMRLLAGPPSDGDPWQQIVALFNGSSYAQAFAHPVFAGAPLALHPIQAASHDPIVRTAAFDAAGGVFSVPAYTTAVFVGG